jgi:hypothetical protein
MPDEQLSAEQVELALEALSDYWRACGGIGFTGEFETQEAL